MNILNKLTIKHLKMNKKRTIVSIIGIMLSTALMVGIGLLFSSLHNMMVNTVVSFIGDHHVRLNFLQKEDYAYIEHNINIQDVSWNANLGYGKEIEKTEHISITMGYDQKYLETLPLKEGRIPQNQNEILLYKNDFENLKSAGLPHNIGDTISLDLHQRYEKGENGKEYQITGFGVYGVNLENEIWKKIDHKDFKIVGIIDKENYYSREFITIFDPNNIKDALSATITFKNVKKTRTYTESLIKQLTEPELIDAVYNNALLSLYGVSTYDNINNTMTGIMSFILFMVSLGCTIVIYNSFAISVMERKKQFGLFSSIGATSKQLRKTVYFEALIVGSIGIILGLIGAFVGIYAVLQIANYLVRDIFGFDFQLVVYPVFIMLPILFMIFTVLFSAYLPARRASKISPIQAIRLNDDIKVNNRKIRTSGIVKRIFGIEGDLAIKNIKRNKKKYRITVISLFISIVLFISFSTFLEYGLNASDAVLNLREYDIQVYDYGTFDTDFEKFFQDIKALPGTEKAMMLRSTDAFAKIPYQAFTQEYLDSSSLDEKDTSIPIIILCLDDEAMQEFKEINNISEEHQKTKGYFVNRIMTLKDNKASIITPLKEDIKTVEVMSTYDENDRLEFQENIDIKVVKNINSFLEKDYNSAILVVSQEFFKDTLIDTKVGIQSNILIKATEHKKVASDIETLQERNQNTKNYQVYDLTETMKMEKNIILVISILLYGFIALITLIGVTSVFNTINTSMQLRRKEFAVLRSIGLSPKGFNRMLRLESIFYGLKSLLYALPVSFLIILWLNNIFGNVLQYGILIPWKAIIIAVVAVFIITFITMNYATKKIKKENILESIREENI